MGCCWRQQNRLAVYEANKPHHRKKALGIFWRTVSRTFPVPTAHLKMPLLGLLPNNKGHSFWPFLHFSEFILFLTHSSVLWVGGGQVVGAARREGGRKTIDAFTKNFCKPEKSLKCWCKRPPDSICVYEVLNKCWVFLVSGLLVSAVALRMNAEWWTHQIGGVSVPGKRNPGSPYSVETLEGRSRTRGGEQASHLNCSTPSRAILQTNGEKINLMLPPWSFISL